MNRRCGTIETRLAAIPYPIDPRRREHYLMLVAEVENDGARALNSLRPPAQIATTYAEFAGRLDQAISLNRQEVATMARHDGPQLGEELAELRQLVQADRVLEIETGLWTCARDTEPRHFVAINPRQRFVAELDQICAPVAELTSDIAGATAVAKANSASETVTRGDIRTHLVSDINGANLALQRASSEVDLVTSPPSKAVTVHDLSVALNQSAEALYALLQALEARQAASVRPMVEGLREVENRVRRDGVRLAAVECAAA